MAGPCARAKDAAERARRSRRRPPPTSTSTPPSQGTYGTEDTSVAVPDQYKDLIDAGACEATEFRFDDIRRKAVIYRGDDWLDGDIEYLNVENYLRGCPDIPTHKAGRRPDVAPGSIRSMPKRLAHRNPERVLHRSPPLRCPSPPAFPFRQPRVSDTRR